jgi:hypothetical protein
MTRLVGFQAADDFNDSTDKMPVGRVKTRRLTSNPWQSRRHGVATTGNRDNVES